MTDGHSKQVPKPARKSVRWTSFVGSVARGRVVRGLEEEGNPQHRIRVEHNRDTLLVHISDEDAQGWTTVAIDRATREWAIAQRRRQMEAAQAACGRLYGGANDVAPQPRPGEPIFRCASPADLPAIVRMLADDALGAARETFESPLPESYYRAFEAIDRDANNELIVAEVDGKVIGVMQITFIPNLTYRGSWRAQIEGVRVDATVRSGGIGRQLFAWAIERARQRGCHLVQLTSDKARKDAIRFYENLGFVASHEGMKLHLDPESALE